MVEVKKRRGRPPIKELTDPQRRSLKTIDAYQRRCGFPPTIKELADLLGVTSATARDQVNQLVRKGYLRRETRKARGISVVRRADEPIAGLTGVPLVGSVAAGRPVLAEENVIGEVMVEAEIAGSGHCFALEVSGDSMTKAGIRDRDVVIVRQQQLADSGQIVVALVNGEATVKRVYFDERLIELRPENSKYRPITIGPETDLRILGKVVAVRRRPK